MFTNDMASPNLTAKKYTKKYTEFSKNKKNATKEIQESTIF